MFKYLFVSFVIICSAAIIFAEKEVKVPNFSKVISSNSRPTQTIQDPEVILPIISLENIFSSSHNDLKNLPPDKLRILIATGDIIPARSVNFQATQRGFTWPFEKTAQVLKDGEITFINLESPLISNCPLTQEGMVFCGDERNVQGLTFAGVDVVSLANNHAGNYGAKGVEDTQKLLENNGIFVTGVNGPVIKEVRGIKFAFLGYDDIAGGTGPDSIGAGISLADPTKIRQEINDVRLKADVVIVTFHWGTEYHSQPDPRQVKLGHLAIDSGADLVIGNHPHWIQPIEIYQGKLITYAHGNFIFDQMWSQKTREGVVGKYTFFDKKLIDVQYLPVQIDDFGQPHFTEGTQRDQILSEMKQESFKLSGSSF